MSGITYDENGNLQAMKQYGLQSNTSPLLDNLTYTSQDYSNKLKSVSDAVAASANSFGDFVNNSSATTEYGYDKNGNLITDLNKKFNGTALGIDQTSGGAMLYNFLDQVYQVNAKDDNNNNKTITYIYDAAGNKLEKRSTAAGGNVTVTTYIGGFIYQNNVLQYFSHEEGRVRVQRDLITGAFKDYVYDYFITDHLGNVRMVLTDEVPDRELYLATMEDASRSFETDLFGTKIGATAVAKPCFFDDATCPVPASNPNQKVSRVNGSTADGRVGPGLVLKVMAGDKFKGSTYAWYQPSGMDNTVDNTLGDIVVNLLSQLTPEVSYFGKGMAGGNATNAILQPGLKTFSGTQTPAASAPRAYLNYVLLDEKSFKTVQSGFIAVPQITGTQAKQLLQLSSGNDISLTHNGYLYVWVSNESKGNVYFDDIRVEHQQGPLLEENHYYPYGLKMAALSSRAFGSLINKCQYQGSYSEWNEETGYNEFTLRSYDPQLGRWTGVDPYDEFPSPYVGMGNNPVNCVDPNGGSIDLTTPGLGAFAGWSAGLLYGVISGKDNPLKYGLIGAGIGAGVGLLSSMDFSSLDFGPFSTGQAHILMSAFSNVNSSGGIKQKAWASKYGFYVHQEAIRRAVEYSNSRGTKSENEKKIKAMDEGTEEADSDPNQTGAKSFQHAMRWEGHESVREAMKNADNFVRQKFAQAIDLKNQGKLYGIGGAYYTFTQGLHTLQDATSPAHHGFQPWSDNVPWYKLLIHISKESSFPANDYNSQLQRITNYYLNWFENPNRPVLPKENLFKRIGSD